MKLYRRTLIIDKIGETVVIHAHRVPLLCLTFLITLIRPRVAVSLIESFRWNSTHDSLWWHRVLQRIVHRSIYLPSWN